MAFTRPLEAGDIPTVASLFMTVMRGSSLPAPASLEAYLHDLFVAGPMTDSEVPPQVYVRDDGGVGGFIGVTVQVLQAGNRRLRAAICGTLMVRDHQQDPMAGARLLRSFLAGPQDISLSETAGDASLAMWRQVGGSVLPLHSLDWVRVIRPATFALRTLQTRVPAAGLAAPVAATIDRVLEGRNGKKPLRWTSLPRDFAPPGACSVQPVDAAGAVETITAIASRYQIVPLWPGGALTQILDDAASKAAYGTLRRCIVCNAGGEAIGVFQYHLRRGGIAWLLFLLAMPGQRGRVLDAVLADAAGRGAVAIRGRTDPQLFDALLSRRTLMLHTEASVVHSKDAELVASIARGDTIFNGVVGERWMRLIGDHFE